MKTFAAIALFVCIWAMPVRAAAAPEKPVAATQPAQHEVIKAADFAIAVPQGWRQMDEAATGRMIFFRQGDGIGVPTLDDTGEPLQLGMTLEKFPSQKTVEQGIEALIRVARSNPRLKLVGEPKTEKLKLSDGADAMLLTTEFIKDDARHSLQFKLVSKDPGGNAFIASGFLVGGRDSKWEKPDSALAKWVKGYVNSFTQDPAKLDTTKLPGPFVPEESKP